MATISGLVEASSMLPVAVVTGSEARPSTTARVLWIGGTTRPSFMAEGDIWLRVATTGAAAPEILTSTLNTMTVMVAFSQALALNGTPPYTFTIVGGALPTGLAIHSTSGVISGTPTVSGAYSFTVKVDNSVGTATRAFTGTVSSTTVAPAITTTVLSTLTQGAAFSQTLNATGTTPLTWTISGGVLPSGLTLNSANGTITGSPTGTGSYSFTVQVSNTAGFASQLFAGNIASTGSAPVITTTSLNAMQAGFSFSQTLNKTGSTPMTWGVSVGTIPAGLSINSSTGVISGTPTTSGAYSFTVSATNSFGTGAQAYTGTIDTSAGLNVFSVHGSAAPFSLTSYSDAAIGSWVSQQYYQATTGPALPAGSKIIGARIYVPAGSAHLGAFWYGALYNNPGGYRVSTFPVGEYETNGTKKAGSPLVEGWNQLLFTTEYDAVPPGGSWLIGVQIGDGTKYLHDTTYTDQATKNPEGKNFWLAEVFGGSIVRRGYYNGDATLARSYGIDVLMRVP